jgi:hypothetical protein
MTNNDLQNTTQTANDSAVRTPIKTGDELRCQVRIAVPAVLVARFVFLYFQTRS